jgi:outer membrane scaffolding protein for murein synthesis (MipA/OmpV family)
MAQVLPQEPPEPLWELGFGAGGLFAPDYPSSSESHPRGLALPYIIYRGDIFRLGDGQTARAVAFESDRVELDLSFDAAFDSDSEKNDLRGDMPDLDYMFQLGPQLTLLLGAFEFQDDSHAELELALQARAVFSSDLTRIDQHGYVFEPLLQYQHHGRLWPGLTATFSLRPLWATRELHAYFYEVEPAFATPLRPAYESRSGYFGTELNFFGEYDLNDDFRFFFGLQTSWHHGAANTDSPLFQDRFTASVGAGFVWSLIKSERMIQR